MQGCPPCPDAVDTPKLCWGSVLGFPLRCGGHGAKPLWDKRGEGSFSLLGAAFDELTFLKEPVNIWSPAAGSALPAGSALWASGCCGELGPAFRGIDLRKELFP